MKRALYCLSGLLMTSSGLHASALFSENFDSYNNGNLVGQGLWQQTGTGATSPVQVSNGKVVLGTSGQDIFCPLSSSLVNADGSTYYVGLTLNVSSAQATGDYFLHVTPTVGNSSLYFSRLYAKSSDTGFVLGWLETSGPSSLTPTYGTTTLKYNTDYRVVVAYNTVAGTLNDTGAVYVDPTDASSEMANTAYLTKTWTSTSAENNTVAAINLRQGSAANAAALSVDNLVLSQTFADVSGTPVVPEPSTFALMGLGVAGLLVHRRRKA